jgi:hypothetical protein
MAKQRYYRHIQGGCIIRGKRYPCDDTYISLDKVIEVTCTHDAHFSMPKTVRYPSQLRRKKGVKSVKVIAMKKWSD